MRFYTNIYSIGDHFLTRGYENGSRFTSREKFYPTLFVPSNKKTKYKTLDNDYVEEIKPGTVRECRDFIKKYESVDNFNIYGNDRFLYQYISEIYPEDEIKYDINQIKLFFIDIEVESENGFPDVESSSEEILLITIQDYFTKKMITWGKGKYSNTDKNVKYIECKSEYDLLLKFVNYWSDANNTPDIISGWNSKLYDIPYICRRISRILGEKELKKLSPWGQISERKLGIKNRDYITFDIAGVSQLDYLDLYKKFTYKAQESYRLDYIAEVELGRKKLDHSEFETFREFYTKGWDKFVSYNIIDTQLVERLEDKMKLIELVITMAYDAKVNYDDVFYQVRMWDTIIYNFLKKKNIAIPPNKKSEKTEYAGAFVKEPIPGVYDWVVSFDLTSLYPSLIMQFNISPETLLPEKYPNISVDKLLSKELEIDKIEGRCIAANGSIFDTTKRGIFPELVERIFSDRQKYKKKMIAAKQEYEKNPTKQLEKDISRYNNIQMARKIQINSLYGSIGNNFFRYYKLENAEAITLSGQFAIRWIADKLNQYLNKILKTDDFDFVIASDTDSLIGDTEIYVTSEKIKIEDFYNNLCSNDNLICKRDENDYIHNVSNLNLYTKSYDGEKIIDDKIIHIMKHKVKKKFYRITVNGNEVVLTEDHSLIVERNGELISVKPQDVIENDIFINISDTGLCLKTTYNYEETEKKPNY